MRCCSALWLGLVLVFPFGMTGCSNDDFGQVAEFRLTELGGQTISRETLSGKVWIAAFIFTRCAGPCSQVSLNMSRLQDELSGQDNVRLVSFTVDPEYDRPEVLSRYATRFHADSRRWLFLTGTKDEVYSLIRNSFQLAAQPSPEPKPGYEVDHSTKLALIDGRGHIRGYFDGADPEQLPKLKREAIWLARLNGLPALNAVLNAGCASLLLLGYVAIRRRWVILHKSCMLSALAISAVFLTSYLYFHLVVRGGEPTYFKDRAPDAPDWLRHLYTGILLSHTALAIIVAPLAVFTAYQGLRDRLVRHVRIARWTLPIWLYVSVTGVVVYWMLYRLYPSP